MRDHDMTIDAALAAEEKELLRKIGEEPAYLQQAMGIFEGRTGWVNAVLMVTQAVAFIAGVWAAWQFFAATDALTAVRWGLPAVTLLLMALTIKMALWPTIQANRVIRELRRLELVMVSRKGD
nr:DUF6768 family protein [uncultured Sphingomonas sp.]